MKTNYLKKFLVVGYFLWTGFLLSETALNGGSQILSPKIHNEEELELILKEEVSKLGMNDKEITAKFGKSRLGFGQTALYSNGRYEIILDAGKNRANLKHELYHIYDGHFNSILKIKNPLSRMVYSFFVCEPQSLLYQSLGIKI